MQWTNTPLLRHQDYFVEQLLRDDHATGFANFGEPGTGKTLALIAGLVALRKRLNIRLRTLIVCPKSMILPWVETLRQEIPAVTWGYDPIIEALSPRGHMHPLTDIIVTNYERVSRTFSKDAKSATLKWPNLVILDEAHRIKNPTAQCTKALKRIKAPYRWIATGTPAANGPLDVWSLIDFIRPGWLHKSMKPFRDYYADVYYGAGFPKINGYRNQDELRERVSRYSVRVLRDECLDLPSQTFTTQRFTLSPTERRVYGDVATELVSQLSGDVTLSVTTALQKMLRLSEITSGYVRGATDDLTNDVVAPRWIGSSRIDAAMDLLDTLPDERVVIFARFLPEVEGLLMRLEKTPARAITSATSATTRQETLRWFRETPGARIIATYGTISEGVNDLIGASYMIFLSQTYSLTQRDQAAARIYRKGQTRHVTYYTLIADGTIDASIATLVEKKTLDTQRVTPASVWSLIRGNV